MSNEPSLAPPENRLRNMLSKFVARDWPEDWIKNVRDAITKITMLQQDEAENRASIASLESRLSALTAENARLRAALEGLLGGSTTAMLENMLWGDLEDSETVTSTYTLGTLRKARAALVDAQGERKEG